MKQYEAVILALEKLGGQATLADLYRETMKVEDTKWGQKLPLLPYAGLCSSDLRYLKFGLACGH